MPMFSYSHLLHGRPSGPFQSTVSRFIVCHVHGKRPKRLRRCATVQLMRVGPSEPACRSRLENHLRRLCPKGKVVNAEGKGLELLGQVTGKKRTARDH